MRLRHFCSRLHLVGAVGLAAAVLGVGACGGSLPAKPSDSEVAKWVKTVGEVQVGGDGEVEVSCASQPSGTWHCPTAISSLTSTTTTTIYVKDVAGQLVIVGSGEAKTVADKAKG